MIKNLRINQETKSLEYAVENMVAVCNGDECFQMPPEKIEVYKLMQKVIKNWNENNPRLQL